MFGLAANKFEWLQKKFIQETDVRPLHREWRDTYTNLLFLEIVKTAILAAKGPGSPREEGLGTAGTSENEA